MSFTNKATVLKKKCDKKGVLRRLVDDRDLVLLILPGLMVIVLFKLIPIVGILMAFEKYKPNLGIFGSEWVGLKYFVKFFNDPFFFRVMKNTFMLGIVTLVYQFPAPILLALLLNELTYPGFKRVVQTISYMPHFISLVIVVGFLHDIFGLSSGVLNDIFDSLGMERIDFIGQPQYFRFLYVLSAVWQGIGYNSIIYLAAISGVSPELYESAYLDGAKRIQQIIYITLPCIMPTVIILFIINVGGILGNDFQKILLIYSPGTYETADTVSTYTYRLGIEGASYSYSTAIGLFMSVLSFILLFITNKISKAVNEISLW